MQADFYLKHFVVDVVFYFIFEIFADGNEDDQQYFTNVPNKQEPILLAPVLINDYSELKISPRAAEWPETPLCGGHKMLLMCRDR